MIGLILLIKFHVCGTKERKMKKLTYLVVIVLVSIFLTGCGNKAQYGAAGGAAGGALIGQTIGHNTEATLIGTAIGAFLGYATGNEMDKFDRDYRIVPRQQQPQYYQAPQQQHYRSAPPRYQPRQQQWQEGW